MHGACRHILGEPTPFIRFGAKNIYELWSVIPIPLIVLALDFLAKVCLIGGVTAIFTAWHDL